MVRDRRDEFKQVQPRRARASQREGHGHRRDHRRGGGHLHDGVVRPGFGGVDFRQSVESGALQHPGHSPWRRQGVGLRGLGRRDAVLLGTGLLHRVRLPHPHSSAVDSQDSREHGISRGPEHPDGLRGARDHFRGRGGGFRRELQQLGGQHAQGVPHALQLRTQRLHGGVWRVAGYLDLHLRRRRRGLFHRRGILVYPQAHRAAEPRLRLLQPLRHVQRHPLHRNGGARHPFASRPSPERGGLDLP